MTDIPRVRQIKFAAFFSDTPGVLEAIKGTEMELSAVAAKSSAGNVLHPVATTMRR